MAMNFHPASPILPVKVLKESLRYYIDVLGFRLDWEDPGIMASVSRERCNLMLCEGDQGHPGTWVWIGVGDADALCEEYRARKAIIRHPPTNYYWALEFHVEDPDGNVLRFGSDPLKDQPFGPWKDMHGMVWTKSEDGKGWKKV